MQLIDIQRRFVEVGRLRYGEKVPIAGGKSRPKRLETWRLTSPNKEVIKAAAARYGGSVAAWEDQWEVITESATLEVMIPPQTGVRSYSLYYELWSGGGCQRRCDGTTELLSGEGCLCDPDQRECKPTLRVPFFLPDLPGLGVFRLETGGFNAAAELPGMLDLLSTWTQAGRPVRALLRLEKRTSKKGGQTRHYTVPVIDLPYSLAELSGTALPALPGNGVPALETHAEVAKPEAEPVIEEPAPGPEAEPVRADAPPKPAPGPQLDDPLPADELERWRAGLHAAMRERMQPDQDEHTELRTLAQVVVGLGDRSLNDMTYREWIRLARALQGIPKVEVNEAGGASSGGRAANSDSPSAIEPPPASDVSPPSEPATTEQAVEPGARARAAEQGRSEGHPASPAPSVGLPLSKDAFQVWAAAALGIETTDDWALDSLNQAEADRVVELLGMGDVEYADWYARCQRPLRAFLMDRHVSPRQLKDRAAAAEAQRALTAASTGTTA